MEGYGDGIDHPSRIVIDFFVLIRLLSMRSLGKAFFVVIQQLGMRCKDFLFREVLLHALRIANGRLMSDLLWQRVLC